MFSDSGFHFYSTLYGLPGDGEISDGDRLKAVTDKGVKVGRTLKQCVSPSKGPDEVYKYSTQSAKSAKRNKLIKSTSVHGT